LAALPLLIGLAPSNSDDDPFIDEGEILDVDGDKFGSTEGAGKANEKEGVVALISCRRGCGGDAKQFGHGQGLRRYRARGAAKLSS
jgi:hypothetical protein